MCHQLKVREKLKKLRFQAYVSHSFIQVFHHFRVAPPNPKRPVLPPHAVLLQHDASLPPSRMKPGPTPWLELHLYHPPAQPQWKGHNLRVLATWERPKQAVAKTH